LEEKDHPLYISRWDAVKDIVHEVGAPSVGELLEELPKVIKRDGKEHFLVFGPYMYDDYWYCYYCDNKKFNYLKYYEYKNQADVCGLMWLWVKKEGLI